MLSRDDVIAAYRFILGRHPESEEVIADKILKTHDIDALRIDLLSCWEFTQLYDSLRSSCSDDLARIFRLSSAVEQYQPLYRLDDLLPSPAKRPCDDRFDLVCANQLVTNFNRSRILDIGCSLGYFSLRFANIGAKVHGFDSNPRCVEIATLLAGLHGLPATFETARCDTNYINALPNCAYDIALCFSVLHHLNRDYGLDYCRELLAALIVKVPVIFIELANKQEEGIYDWKDCLPDDEKDFFSELSDVKIEFLGSSETHLSNTKRNTYLIFNKNCNVMGNSYPIQNISYTSFSQSIHYGTRYITSKDVFIREVCQNTNGTALDTSTVKHLESAYSTSRIANLLQKHFFIDFGFCNNCVQYVFRRIDHPTLYARLVQPFSPEEASAILRRLIAQLFILWHNNYYHNDVRAWNILADEALTEVLLIDYERTSRHDVDGQIEALKWLYADLVLARRERYAYPIPLYNPTIAPIDEINDQLIAAMFRYTCWDTFVKECYIDSNGLVNPQRCIAH